MLLCSVAVAATFRSQFSLVAGGSSLPGLVDVGAVACPGATLIEPGTISDGTGQYGNNVNCAWTLECPVGMPMLSFSEFRTEGNYDFVSVTDLTTGQQILHVSGSTMPPAQTGSGSTIVVNFHSDQSVVNDGFVAEFTCENVTSATQPPGPLQAISHLDGLYHVLRDTLTNAQPPISICGTGAPQEETSGAWGEATVYKWSYAPPGGARGTLNFRLDDHPERFLADPPEYSAHYWKPVCCQSYDVTGRVREDGPTSQYRGMRSCVDRLEGQSCDEVCMPMDLSWMPQSRQVCDPDDFIEFFNNALCQNRQVYPDCQGAPPHPSHCTDQLLSPPERCSVNDMERPRATYQWTGSDFRGRENALNCMVELRAPPGYIVALQVDDRDAFTDHPDYSACSYEYAQCNWLSVYDGASTEAEKIEDSADFHMTDLHQESVAYSCQKALVTSRGYRPVYRPEGWRLYGCPERTLVSTSNQMLVRFDMKQVLPKPDLEDVRLRAPQQGIQLHWYFLHVGTCGADDESWDPISGTEHLTSSAHDSESEILPHSDTSVVGRDSELASSINNQLLSGIAGTNRGSQSAGLCASIRDRKASPGCTLDRDGRPIEQCVSSEDPSRTTSDCSTYCLESCGLCATCQRASAAVEARLLQLGSLISLLHSNASMSTSFCPDGFFPSEQSDEWAVLRSHCFGSADATYAMDFRRSQMTLRTINQGHMAMSFSVDAPNARGRGFAPAPQRDPRTRISARVWESQYYSNYDIESSSWAGECHHCYNYGMPPLKAGAIRGFGTTLCPDSGTGSTTIHRLFLTDSPDATHLFEPTSGRDTIGGITPGSTIAFVSFVTTGQYGCGHELSDIGSAGMPFGSFPAGLAFSVFEAAVQTATCAYTDSCPGGPAELCTDPCACSTGLVPRTLHPGQEVQSRASGQVVQSRSVGCYDGQCRMTNPGLCPTVHTSHATAEQYVDGSPRPEMFPLGWDYGVYLYEQPHYRQCSQSGMCPESACHPEASCVPTIGGHMCQCRDLNSTEFPVNVDQMVRGTCHEDTSCYRTSTQSGCICGSASVSNDNIVDRTYTLLGEAQDSRLKGNPSATIEKLNGLCLEAYYPLLDCLRWTQQTKSEMVTLYQLSCSFAHNADMGHNVYSILSNQEVLPLSDDFYASSFRSVMDYLRSLDDAVRAYSIAGDSTQGQLAEYKADIEAEGSSLDLLTHKIYMKQQLMDASVALIRKTQQAINAKVQSLGYSMNGLISDLRMRLSDTLREFERAKAQANRKDVWALIGSIIKAAIDIVVIVVAPEFSVAEIAAECAVGLAGSAAANGLSSVSGQMATAPNNPYDLAVFDTLNGLDAAGGTIASSGGDPTAWSDFKSQMRSAADDFVSTSNQDLAEASRGCGGLMADAAAIFNSAKALANDQSTVCGELTTTDCDSYLQQMRQTKTKIRISEAFVNTLPALVQLNHAITSGTPPSSEDILRIHLDAIQLDRVDDADTQALGSIGGAEAEVSQQRLADVVRLLKTKLAQTKSYYDAALEMRDMQLQQEWQRRQQSRLSELYSMETDQAKRYGLMIQRGLQKIRTYAYIALSYLFAEARSIEYFTLQHLSTDFAALQTSNVSELINGLDQASIAVRYSKQQYLESLSSRRTSCWSSITFPVSEWTAAETSTFLTSGSITLYVAMPRSSETDWKRTIFVDVRAFAVGVPPSSGMQGVSLEKMGRSSFYDDQKSRWDFIHTNLTFGFFYRRDDCVSSSSAIETPDFINFSPFGPWHVRFDVDTTNLEGMTAVRLEFLLQADTTGGPVFIGEEPCDCGLSTSDECAAVRCGTHQSSQTPATSSQQQSASDSTVSPPPPPHAAEPTCNGPEFFARIDATTAACCDDEHPCRDGLPTACTASCAAVLLPMQRDCTDMMTITGTVDTIDMAASKCTPPCSTGSEFFAYVQIVTAACCGDPAASCTSGFPTASCNAECAAVLPPMQAACGTMLNLTQMDIIFLDAVRTCSTGH